MKSGWILTFTIMILLVASFVYSAEVKNERVRQDGNRVVFEYDLEGDEADISVQITVEGKNYTAKELHLEGDYGKVRPGKNRRVYWNVLQDFPRGLHGDVSAEIEAGGGAIKWEKDKNVMAVIETKYGDIELKFFPDAAPRHVENFIKLVRGGFYDGTIFHRVIPGFMIQGGDPHTKGANKASYGSGGPGYNVNAEFSHIGHARGILSMARSSDPNSAGSQFFIMVKAAPQLNGQYTVFGEVVRGMDVVDKIVNLSRDSRDMPAERVEMKVKIMEPRPEEKEDPEALYQKGYKEIISKDYPSAVETFQKLLSSYPDHKYAGNAQYWIGEIYYAKGDWEKSILEFDKVIKKYPSYEKAAAAFLKQGFAFEKIGSKKESTVILGSVIERFPKSLEAGLAKKKLDTMK